MDSMMWLGGIKRRTCLQPAQLSSARLQRTLGLPLILDSSRFIHTALATANTVACAPGSQATFEELNSGRGGGRGLKLNL